MKKHLLQAILFLCFCVSCSKSGPTPAPNPLLSSADMIAGTFNGTGGVLADGLNLGTSQVAGGCITPAALANDRITGTASITISKISDSTVSIAFNTGVFSNAPQSYSRNIVKSGNLIQFSTYGTPPFESLSYNVNTKELTVGISTGTIPASWSCNSGMPYYYAEDDYVNNLLDYTSFGRIEFSGSK